MSRLSLPHHYTGKVRELYEVDHDRMLVVASDRVSVFDVVLPDLIPDKGRVLTALSTFWFEQTAHLAPNHLVSSDPTDFPETAGAEIAGRAMLVKAARPVRLECVARFEVDAERAYQWGMLNHLVPSEKLEETTRELCARMIGIPPRRGIGVTCHLRGSLA